MTPKNSQKLYCAFPELFRGREKPLTESLMAFGFSCGDGWYVLIETLCRDLMQLCQANGWPVPEVVQVKEKFGGLRFYIDGGNPAIQDRINQAEEQSLQICEVCAGPGKINEQGYWLRVRCAECEAREGTRRNSA